MGSPLFMVLAGGFDKRGPRSMASLFGDVDEATHEFSRTEGRLRGRDGWVELAFIDEQGRLSRLRRSGA